MVSPFMAGRWTVRLALSAIPFLIILIAMFRVPVVTVLQAQGQSVSGSPTDVEGDLEVEIELRSRRFGEKQGTLPQRGPIADCGLRIADSGLGIGVGPDESAIRSPKSAIQGILANRFLLGTAILAALFRGRYYV